ncbi:MAG: DUF3341 domain-containing protein [Polyangiaceae bacterium]
MHSAPNTGRRGMREGKPAASARALLAEFDSPDALVRAYLEMEGRGYVRLRSWTPYPVPSLVSRLPPSPIPWWMMTAAIVGGGLGYLIQWWCNARSFPIDVGGRPLDSVPAFVPIAFESAVLASSVTGFLAMLGLSGLPRLHHPVFAVDGFERASVDRFWLGIDEADPAFDDRVADDLARLGALRCERIGDIA